MNWVRHYLYTLKVKQESPTLAFLEKLTTAHLQTFPFENISKLMNPTAAIPAPDELLGLRETFSLAGTCYTINANLYRLLHQLHFDCQLLMVGGVHLAILVQLDKTPYYIDCGSNAPLFVPLPLGKEQERQFGQDRVKITQIGSSSFEHKRFFNEQQTGTTWSFHTNEQVGLNDFSSIIQNSYRDDGPFMTIIRCHLYQLEQQRSVSLLNNIYTIHYHDGTTTKKQLDSAAEMEQVLRLEFKLPHVPVRSALRALEQRGITIFPH
ncbi:hypothetical protein JCM19046_4209 [Bacillus sp. JCM 19046]|nr:hypothetical protein JCM19045_4787 [Bacillus sp. JCM 19045]GAF19550.1 hypothetical protein JCM19046_4209 [Bacillus sp. JCM 19046]